MSFDVLVRKSKITADQQELNHLDVKQQWVLVKHDLNESHEEQAVALESEHSSLVLLKVRLGAQSNHCIPSSDKLSHLENHYHAENKVSVLEKLCMRLEHLNRNVEVNPDVL